MNNPIIDKLVQQNCKLWHNKHRFVKNTNIFRSLQSAMPVCWFGNLDSPKPLILTIGANPSSKEFINYKGLHRFGNVNSSASVNAIEDSYNAYFRVYPYRKWFDKIEPLLNQFGASYYDSHPSIAIHLDIVSLPTYKSSDLRSEQMLINAGSTLSKQLLDHLINSYNVQKIIIVGGFNYNQFMKLYGVNPSSTYKLPYIFPKSGKTSKYSFVSGNYYGVPFYGTSIYLPNSFMPINYPQLYNYITNGSVSSTPSLPSVP